jgi:hypothetical protein
MSRKILNSNAIVWSIGLLAFALLCAVCIYQHAPRWAGAESANAAPVTSSVVSANLEARLFNGNVILTGMLPDQSAKAQVLSRAKQLYGDGKFVDNLKVSSQSAFPSAGWFNAALSLLPVANRINNEGSITLEGKTAIVRDLVESEESKSKLFAAVVNVVGTSLRVEDRITVKRMKGSVTPAQVLKAEK